VMGTTQLPAIEPVIARFGRRTLLRETPAFAPSLATGLPFRRECRELAAAADYVFGPNGKAGFVLISTNSVSRQASVFYVYMVTNRERVWCDVATNPAGAQPHGCSAHNTPVASILYSRPRTVKT
jgi:hypothetical protein